MSFLFNIALKIATRAIRQEKDINYCTHMYVKGKMRPVETIPGMVRGGIKENRGGGEFKYDIFVILEEHL
jgi:hypothetical protein